MRRKWCYIICPAIPNLILLVTLIVKISEDPLSNKKPIIRPPPFHFEEQLTDYTVTTTSSLPSTLTKEPLANDISEPERTIFGSGFLYFQTIRECQCSRRVMYPPPQQIILSKLNSSCSDEGTQYQFNQNVISTCMHFKVRGKFSTKIHSIWNYQPGVLQNLIMMRQHFPGYSFRIYTDLSLKVNSSWCEILCKNEDVFWCDIRKTPSHGNLKKMDFRSWRFLVLGDPTVKLFLSRDLDSLLSYREGAVVQDWLENVGNKAFQVMRDRKMWHNISFLGGLWGAQNTRLLENSTGVNLREKIIKMSHLRMGYGTDQKILHQLIFVERASDVVAYDSYQCKSWWNYTEVRPFPVQRRGHPVWDFVGTIVDFRKMNNAGEENKTTKGRKGPRCPVECRPDYGKDWIFC